MKKFNKRIEDLEVRSCNDKLTTSGKHIITTPFDVQKFRQQYPDIEIHKDNPTNLYIP